MVTALGTQQQPRTVKELLDALARRHRQDAALSTAVRGAREEQMRERRELTGTVPAAGEEAAAAADAVHTAATLAQLSMARHSTPKEKLAGMTGLRKLLSSKASSKEPIDAVLATGVLPLLLACLDDGVAHELQYEAAWCLTNIAGGTSAHVTAVVTGGGVPPLVRLLSCAHAPVEEQAAWCLGNIAGDGVETRDAVLAAGGLPRMLALCRTSGPGTSWPRVRTALWSIVNLCRAKPAPDPRLMSTAMPVLISTLQVTDAECLSDALWALSYMTDGSDELAGDVAQTPGVLARVVELLLHPDHTVVAPALRAVGNLVSAGDETTQAVLDSGLLAPLKALLASPREGTRKEAAWTLSNVTAGTRQQVQQVVDSNILPSVKQLMDTGRSGERKECLWVVANMTTGDSPDHIACLVQTGLVSSFIQAGASAVGDHQLASVVVDGVVNILRAGGVNRRFLEPCAAAGLERMLTCISSWATDAALLSKVDGLRRENFTAT